MDVGIFGYFRDAGEVYFPSAIEWAVGLGVVAAAILVFFFVTEQFPIFRDHPPAERKPAGLFHLAYGSLRQLWNTALMNSLHRVTLLAVFVIPVAFVLMYPPYQARSMSDSAVRPATGIDAGREVLKIDGDRGGFFTIFAHAEHQKRLGDSTSCGICHHVSLPGDKSTPCSRCHRSMNQPTAIFDHHFHMAAVADDLQFAAWQPVNHSCIQCHSADEAKSMSSAKDCMQCHEKDMFAVASAPEDINLSQAHSFREAMHGACVDCHREEAPKQGKPALGDCQTCHKSFQTRSPLPQTVAHLDRDQACAPR
jgi:hypothetical protein